MRGEGGKEVVPTEERQQRMLLRNKQLFEKFER